MKFEVQGKIIVAGESKSGVRQRTGKEWHSQECVLETDDQYPDKIVFSHFDREKVLAEGDMVKMSIRISSREYNGRWYCQVLASDIELLGCMSVSQPASAARTVGRDDDLPF